MLPKFLYCCLALVIVCFSANAQGKDFLPDYMKHYHFRYYRLPGQPDSATFFKRMDSAYNRKRIYDSIMQQRIINIRSNHIAYNNRITTMVKRK